MANQPAEKLSFSEVAAKMPWYVWAFLAAIVLYFGYKTVKKEIDKAKVNKAIEIHSTSESTTESDTPINLATVASTVYDAFFNNDWFGWTEDETKAVNAIRPVQQKDILTLMNIYKDLYTRDLKADLIEYISDGEWDSIKYKFQ